MDEVAAAVGVTKPLLYNYYGNKEQLFLACMEPAAEALLESVVSAVAAAPDAPGALRAGIHAFFAFLDADGEAWRLLHDETLPAGGEIATRVNAYRARMEALVTAAIHSESRAVEPLAVAIFGAAEALGRWWLTADGHERRAHRRALDSHDRTRTEDDDEHETRRHRRRQPDSLRAVQRDLRARVRPGHADRDARRARRALLARGRAARRGRRRRGA